MMKAIIEKMSCVTSNMFAANAHTHTQPEAFFTAMRRMK